MCSTAFTFLQVFLSRRRPAEVKGFEPFSASDGERTLDTAQDALEALLPEECLSFGEGIPG